MSEANPRTESLFWSALAIPSPEERARYLDESCGGDHQLRGRVEELLAAYPKVEGFLEHPVRSPVVTGDEQPVSEGPGTVIGPYQLREQIGEGGFGVVFRAEQTQPVRRQVALKVLKPGMDTRQVVARFEAERQALALMDHPHIAQIHDGGTTSDGRPFFVMELVKGIPITDYCEQCRLMTRERLELFLAVCHAVQHAHQKGVIHRDLKPSNVLVAIPDGQPVVKVIDFGVAKAVNQRLSEHTLQTGFHQMIGTPLYMSPEQAEMSPLDVDTRADIYALGVLLYELLTGTTPFEQERMGKASFDEIRRIIREEEPPRPSARLSTLQDQLTAVAAQRRTEPRHLLRTVQGELDWIVMKALEKDRNRRYETANDFAADVLRYLADEQVLACPPSAGYRLRKFARRNKGRLAVAAGVFLAVMVMAASIGWSVGDRAARRASVGGQVRDSLNTARTLVAENNLARAREKLAQARAQLGNDRSALGNLAAEVAAGEAELDRFQQFLDLIDRAHQAETAPLLESTLTADGSPAKGGTTASATTRGWQPAAVPFLLEALQRYGILERDDWNSTLEDGLLGRQQVEHIRRLAYEELLWLATDAVYRQQDHWSERKLSPEAAASQALVYLAKAEGAHRPTQALFVLRARCYKAVGEEAAAQADTQRADQTPATMATDHFLQGQAAHYAKQLAEAVLAFEAALRLDPSHYWSMIWLGSCLNDLGQRPEDFEKGALVYTGCILKRPDHAHAYFCRANAYTKLRRYDEAMADYSRAVELDTKDASAWSNRGIAYFRMGRLDKALTDFSTAIEVDPKYVPAWFNRGLAYGRLGQPDKAIADFSTAIELDPKFASAWNYRGIAYKELDQLDKAVADLSRAIELNPKHAPAWYNRGVIHDRLNQLAQAVTDYSMVITLDPKYVNAWCNRGAICLSLNQLTEAVVDFSMAIDLGPNSPQLVLAYLGRAQAHSQLAHFEQARADYQMALKRAPAHAGAHNGLAWLLATYPDAKVRDPDQAVALAKKAVHLEQKAGNYWQTLGVALYRAGDWKAAVAAFDKSRELRKGRDIGELLFLAMAQWKLGNPDEARKEYERAVGGLEKNKEALEKDKAQAEELRRFRVEAEEVLELKKK